MKKNEQRPSKEAKVPPKTKLPLTPSWVGRVPQLKPGKYADGMMRFLFTRTNPQGQAVTIRFSFHNLGADRVRQIQETSTDSGKTFSTNYDFIYIRKGSGAKP